jgi:hypothetical protein
LVISRFASGLFFFTSAGIRLIDNDNPVYLLNVVVSLVEQYWKGQVMQTNPFEVVKKLVDLLPFYIPFRTSKLILGYLIIQPHVCDCPSLRLEPFWISNILGVKEDAMYGALRALHSVLAFSEPRNALDTEVRFLDAFFPHHLNYPERPAEYLVSLDEIATFLWRRFMAILQQCMITGCK